MLRPRLLSRSLSSSAASSQLFGSLRAPVIAAPMFILSNPDLVLAQWVNIALCYRAVTSHEERRGRSYGWLLRTRTDLVYLAPFPFAAFRRDRAYVPVGGMNPCVSPKSIPRSAVS